MMLIFELFERAALARQCARALQCVVSCLFFSENNQLDIESLNLKPVQSAVISADDFGEQTLDEIMGQYEASVLRAFYAQYPSTRKLAQRLGVSHTAIANKLKQYGISK